MTEQWGAGDRSKWSDHGYVKIGRSTYPLIYGEHPHSRSDNRHYVDMGAKEPVGFDGHRVMIDVRVTSTNYLKESELSGDQVRKGGSCEIIADGDVVFEFFHRDAQGALLRAHHLIGQLFDAGGGDWMIKDRREKLVGRKLFYREHPAYVERLIVDQGCLILRTESGEPFPAPVWRKDGDFYDGDEPTAKVEVIDPHIWWWRE